MRRSSLIVPVCLLALIAVLASLGAAPARAADPASADEGHWPSWRGPVGTGEAPGGDPPVEWSESKNVRFKVDVPGSGLGTPVVWGDRLYLTTAVPTGKKEQPEGGPTEVPEWMQGRGVQPEEILDFRVLAYDRMTGKLAWEQSAVKAVPHESIHMDGSWAGASAVTDGEVVCASFGSQGIYCYTVEGKLLWSKDLGDMTTRNGFGEGASPALHGDTLVVNWDHEGPSFIVALDRMTGKELWRKSRDEVTSWSTPMVVEAGGKRQVVVNATDRVRAYDLATGDVVWEVGGMTTNAIPSPVADGELLFVTSGFRGNALVAVRLAKAKGDLTDVPAGEGAVAWRYDRDTPYVPSPLLYGGNLYILKHNKGILSAFEAATGKVHYAERLDGVPGVYASPVAADGRIYIAGRDGTTVVLAAGPELKVLAANELDDRFDASPAVVGDILYLRGHDHLYALESGAGKAEAGNEAAPKQASDKEVKKGR